MGEKQALDNSARVLRFGAFELDTEQQALFERGRRVALQEMPLKVLTLLLEEPGQVVTHETFYQRVWPEDELGMVEDNLYTAVGKLRRVLHDNTRHPQFIETVPRRGYRFVAPVTDASSESPPPASNDSTEKKHRPLRLWGATVAVGLVLAGTLLVAGRVWFQAETPGPPEAVTLAVLPFDNLGQSEDEYFADGIIDEISGRLAHIDRISLIARTSTMRYRDTTKSVPEIADELGVDYILEGTVRWNRSPDGSSRVRITPQLIRADDASQLWAEIIDKPHTGVFELQATVAEEVTEALDIALAGPEHDALEIEPTDSLEAYDFYLRGNEYAARSLLREQHHRLALSMYEKAVARDPEFARAHARIGRTHLWLYHYDHDRSDERLAQARAAIDRALELDPDLPEAHLQLAWYHYWGHRDYERALQALTIAREAMPGDDSGLMLLGYIQRRQGRWEAALDNHSEAVRLDPRSASRRLQLANTRFGLRNYTEARGYLEKAIELSPGRARAHADLARAYWRTGDTNTARAVLGRAARVPGLADDPELGPAQVRLHKLKRDYQAMLDHLETAAWTHQYWMGAIVPADFYRALAHDGLGDQETAREYYQQARTLLEDKLAEAPDHHRLHAPLGRVLVGLGEHEEAVRAGQRAVETVPIEEDALVGPWRLADLARIHARVGNTEAAIELLEHLLATPGPLTTQVLKLDPTWDPLREHPEFQRLLEAYST